MSETPNEFVSSPRCSTCDHKNCRCFGPSLLWGYDDADVQRAVLGNLRASRQRAIAAEKEEEEEDDNVEEDEEIVSLGDYLEEDEEDIDKKEEAKKENLKN